MLQAVGSIYRNTDTHVSFVSAFFTDSFVWTECKLPLLASGVSGVFFLYNMMMMTLGQGNGAAGCVFLCSCPLSKYKAVLASSFPLSSTLCSAGCTLIRHMSVSLTSKIYTLGSILFGSSLFWLLSKHNYVVVITLFHAAQDLLKCNAL